MATIRRHSLALCALLFFNLVVFARLVFLGPGGIPYATIPFDFASQYSVWLVYIGDSFHSGVFPLWCPYVGGGTPFFINPQNQLYSPLTLLVGPVFGYTQRAAQLQSVFMLFFGGAGAYALSYTLWRSRWAGLAAAVCFNFTSAVYANLEHTTIITAAALMPWLFWAATRTAREHWPWGYPALAFFTYFLITSGYPGVILMTFLWLAAYAAYLVLTGPDTPREKLRLGLTHGLAFGLGVLMAGAHWIPVVIHRREFTRGAPLNLDTALLGGNLFFKNLWGMLFQFMTENPLPGADADISMRGVYFGALALPLAAAALLLIKDRVVPALLVLTVGSLLMATGWFFFGRIFLHIIFPVLNMSRFPSADSRSLMALGFALLAGGGVMALQIEMETARATVLRGCLALLAALVAGLFIFRAIYPADVYNYIVVNYVTAEILFVAVAALALRAFPSRRLTAALVVLLVLEVGTGVHANMKIVGAPVEGADAYRAARARHRRAFTTEEAAAPRRAVGENLVSEESAQAYLSKTFYLSDYNPLRLHRFDALVRNGFTGWMTDGPRVVALPADAWPGNFDEFQTHARPVDFSILSYTPNEVVYRVGVGEDSMLVFNEIYFPGWRARVDGNRTPVSEVGGGLRAVRVGGGEHTIVMSFRPSSFYVGVGVSLVSAAFFVLWLVLIFRRGRRAV